MYCFLINAIIDDRCKIVVSNFYIGFPDFLRNCRL